MAGVATTTVSVGLVMIKLASLQGDEMIPIGDCNVQLGDEMILRGDDLVVSVLLRWLLRVRRGGSTTVRGGFRGSGRSELLLLSLAIDCMLVGSSDLFLILALV